MPRSLRLYRKGRVLASRDWPQLHLNDWAIVDQHSSRCYPSLAKNRQGAGHPARRGSVYHQRELVATQKPMTKPPKPPKTDEQREAERRRRGFADKLELIVENLGEDDFVSAVKGYKPDITKEELQEWIMRFRAAVREKRGLS